MAATATIDSRVAEVSEPVNALFVMSAVGANAEISAAHFETELLRGGERCGLRIGVSRVSMLELNPELPAAEMKAFGGRHVLRLQAAGGERTQYRVTQARYDAQLQELGATKLLWRAAIVLNTGTEPVLDMDDPGVVLARRLLAQLERDKVIAPCPPETPPRPRSRADIEPGSGR